jgi:hypothetical protein
MDLLTKEELAALTEAPATPTISIFMPTHRVGREVQQNPVRLKNLLGEAKQKLVERGMRSPEAEQLLEPAQALLDDTDFWQHQSDGLAIFAAPDQLRTYRLPLPFEEQVVVNNRFYLKPALPLLKEDGYFYILALSQNEVRLLRGTPYHVDEVEVEGLPQSLAEALKYDEPEKQLQFQTGTPDIRGERAAQFHGHGVGEDDKKERLRRYFQQIDKSLQPLLQNEQAPLVLAGVEYLFPLYREANSYSHLIEPGIEGNPKLLSADDLQAQAWAIVRPILQEAQQAARDRFEQAINTGESASKNIKEIVPAAHYGRVDTLFVAVGQQQWGRFDPMTGVVHLHQEAEPDDEDLLDMAAIQTFLNGGTVYALQAEEMPVSTGAAALFRY